MVVVVVTVVFEDRLPPHLLATGEPWPMFVLGSLVVVVWLFAQTGEESTRPGHRCKPSLQAMHAWFWATFEAAVFYRTDLFLRLLVK